jgi:hypothetical protein
MALHVLAYNLTRVMNIMGIEPLMAAMRAYSNPGKMLPHRHPAKIGDASTLPVKRFYTTKTRS